MSCQQVKAYNIVLKTTQKNKMKKDCKDCIFSLVDNLDTAAFVVESGLVLHANKSFLKIFNAKAKSFLNFPPPEVFNQLYLNSLVPEAISKNRSFRFEKKVTWIDGIEKYILIVITPVKGTPSHAIVRVFDTSGQRRMQIALVQQMRKFRTDDIWILSEDLIPLYVEAEKELIELTKKPDFTPIKLIVEEAREEALSFFGRAKDNPGKTLKAVFRAKRKGKVLTTYIDVVYLLDSFVGGHFFVLPE